MERLTPHTSQRSKTGEATTRSRLVTTEDIQFFSRIEGDHIRTNVTAVKAGPVVTLIRYLDPFALHLKSKRKVYAKRGSDAVKKTWSITRARTKVRNLILSNWKYDPTHPFQNPLWCTFTYPNSNYAKPHNFDFHVKDLAKFFRQLRQNYGQHYGKDIHYLAVPELTKNGNVHWHVLIFNLRKYASPLDIVDLWCDVVSQRGIECHPSAQDINRIPWGTKNAKRTAKQISGYLSKYLGKTFEDQGLAHKKLYLPSKNLLQPQRISRPEQLAELMPLLLSQSYYVNWESEVYDVPYAGRIIIQHLSPDT